MSKNFTIFICQSTLPVGFSGFLIDYLPITGLSYALAGWIHRIRKAMTKRDKYYQLGGLIDLDTYFGGLTAGSFKSRFFVVFYQFFCLTAGPLTYTELTR